MKVSIISVGKVRQSFIKQGEAEYVKRLRGSALAPTLIEMGLDTPESLGQKEAQERESLELLKRVAAGDFLVVLDERGELIKSTDFAGFFEKRMRESTRSIVFAIGGAFGFSEKVRQRADYVLSLSSLTMPHQFARLVLVEQIYRAHTLIRGVAYHK
jgi:23S rRNA (pseudouridine1915-N3)-methyltransferase